MMNYYDEDFVEAANRRPGTKYLFRVYLIFMSQVLLAGTYVLYPGEWWTIIQLSLITSPLVVNIWNYVQLRHFEPLTQTGLLLAEFLILEYFIFSYSIGIIILGLIITFGLCSLLYAFTYVTGNVIVLGLPSPDIVIPLLIVTVISYYLNQIMYRICSSLKICFAMYFVFGHSYIIQPALILDYINAGIKLHLNFLLILTCVIVILILLV